MKRKYALMMITLLLLVLSVQCAEAKKPQSPGSQPSTTSTPTIIKEVINNTYVPVVSPSAPWYKDWNFIAVALAIAGAAGGWLISRKIRGKTAKYMSEIDKAYRSYNKNSNKCEAELANIREQIEDDFKKGKINDQSLAILDSRIDKYAKQLRSEMVDRRAALPDDMKKSIKHMLSDGKITKEEFEHFSGILAKSQMGARDKEEIKGLMKRWKDEDGR